MKKKAYLLIIFLFLVGCYQKVKITGEKEIYINQKIQLTIDGISNDYIWKSSNDEIATVNNGEVTGVSTGEVYITIVSDNKVLATHTIKVKEGPKIALTGNNILLKGETLTLQVNGSNTNDEFNWTSSDSLIATVEDGLVTGHNIGEATIEVMSKDYGYAKIEIKVIANYTPDTIEIINDQEEYIISNEPYQLQAIAYPEYCSQEFKWEVAGDKASINQDTGLITFLDEGDVYIICRSKLDNKIFKTIKLKARYDDSVTVINVLFIGNSLTYVNDIPMMVQSMAKLTGKVVKCKSITPGGNTLAQIINGYSYNIIEELKVKKYNCIIIQEASSANFQDLNSFLNSAIYFKELADTYKAELLLYQTWAYREGCNSLLRLRIDRYTMQQLIIDAYNDVANQTNTKINRVGEVFYAFSLAYPDIELYIDDNHASLAGSYLSSCVHYMSLFHESVINNPYIVDLDANTILLIQTFVSNYFSNNG